jgi:hypothetical protein
LGGYALQKPGLVEVSHFFLPCKSNGRLSLLVTKMGINRKEKPPRPS